MTDGAAIHHDSPTAFAFQVAIDTFEAMEALEAQGEEPTVAALRHTLSGGVHDPSITPERVEQGMAQVKRWRADPHTRAILRYRQRIIAQKPVLADLRLVCHRVQHTLNTVLRELDQTLRDTLTDSLP